MKTINSCILLVLLLAVPLAAQNRFVVEPYLQSPTMQSMKVMWETSLPSRSVLFLAEAKHNTLQPEFNEIGTEAAETTMHSVEIKGLDFGSHYIYQAASVTGTDTLWGPVSRFSLPDYMNEPIVSIVFSDTQKNPSLLGHFATLFAREAPSFLLHTGDLVESGPNKSNWTDQFFYPLRNLLRYYPLYPVLGNHEGNTPFFYQYFDLPEPEWFYTQKKGNALFVFVNTNIDILPGSKQYRLLEKALAESSETWKIVLHHHPVYVSSGYYNSITQKVVTGDPNLPHLRSLYETYGVDLVFNGHIHNYERTMPIFREKIDSERGVVYLTIGGGGGKLDETAITRTWYMAEAKSRHYFIKLRIWDRKLSIDAIDSTGVAFDHWEKVKERDSLAAPLIESSELCFLNKTKVTVTNPNPSGHLVVAVNGNSLATASDKIEIPLQETTLLSAFVKDNLGGESRTATKTFTRLPLNPAQKKTNGKISVEYYEGFFTQLPDFDALDPIRRIESDSLTLDAIRPRAENHWAARFRGRFHVPETNVYRVLLESYDGSRLLIDGREVINNDGMHYEIRMDNYVALEKGEHSFEVHYFDFTRRETLRLWMNPIYHDLIDFNSYLK
jgi:predicted phosphodiesterase